MRRAIVLALFFAAITAGGQVKPSKPQITVRLPLPLDLVADSGYDLNGIPLNPHWGYQIFPGWGPYRTADPRDVCNPLTFQPPHLGPIVLNPACTSQSPSWSGPGGLWSDAACDFADNVFVGHHLWFPVTCTGLLGSFDKASAWGGDDDYSMDLQTPDARGAFNGDSGHVHIEFDSDETVDHFRSSWWSAFRDTVVRDADSIEAQLFISGHQAIVTGLMGIDWIHTPGAELHPVWAIAIQVSGNEWAFFVRNWGNLGQCGSHLWAIDNLPGDTYKFLLPWEYCYAVGGRKVYATDVSWSPNALEYYPVGIPDRQVLINIYKVRTQGVVVAFHLPPPRPGSDEFYEGKISLLWQFPPGECQPPRPPPEPPCNPNRPPGCPPPPPPESNIVRQLGPLLSDGQKAAIAAELKEPHPARASTLLRKDAIQIRKLDHLPSPPVSRPTTYSVIDEKKIRRDKLQMALLCAAFRGNIPGFPKVCARFSADK